MKSILDIAHLTLLETIRETIVSMGEPATKGTLMRRAIRIAEQLPEVEYENLDTWETAVSEMNHPLTKIEGLTERDESIFILPQCPFAQSIATYMELFGQMPEEYSQIVEEYNKPGKFTEGLMVGHGSGVSPFCAIHQPLRSSAGKKIRVNNEDINVIQLGCKAANGKKSISNDLCQIAGVDSKIVEKHLDNGMCVYTVKTMKQDQLAK